MPQAEPATPAPQRPVRPVRTAAIVIYATFALLALTIPQSLVNWLGDMNANPAVEAALRGAVALQNAADAARISAPYRRLHDLFVAVSGAQVD